MPHAPVVLLLLTATTSAVAQAPPPQRPLTVDDLFALKQVGNPQVSPDGRWVAYVVRTLNLKTDRSEAALWMAPLDSGTAGGAIPLTAPGYSPSEARWSPDGRYLLVNRLFAAFVGVPASRLNGKRPADVHGGPLARVLMEGDERLLTGKAVPSTTEEEIVDPDGKPCVLLTSKAIFHGHDDDEAMVVTVLPAAAETGSTHERTGSPFSCTVQAPHCARPQPKCGLSSFKSSRSA